MSIQCVLKGNEKQINVKKSKELAGKVVGKEQGTQSKYSERLR